ncbi:amidohydrolase family protein [Desulfobotulus mexicanus]|uniref:Amidohydrolase family protein n=1 Tax=Desulfobotulus mexicanus TaxID=2586642 RepID=A0A5Q4VJ41_9BACT|nr:amidohydrolase family protein [Desulfobotulus mexicanus]TYT75991.1 amidohydrolase family protein [Desulfobotulus mexicanus]
MRIDCHTHIFPEIVQKNRKEFLDDQSFALLYENPASSIQGPEALLASMDANSIQISLACGFPWRSRQRLKQHNNFLMETSRRYEGRILALCCVNPEDSWAADETERCLRAGALGIGELACYHRDFDKDLLEKLSPIMELCREFQAPILIHTNDPIGHSYPGKAPISLEGIEKLLLRFPENRMILAHGGGGYPFYNLMKKGINGKKDLVAYDTAAFPYLYKNDAYSFLLKRSENPLLFGSDWPLLSPARYFRDMEEAGLSTEEILNLCGKNAARFLWPHT